jgi:hypothetical protein
MESGFAAIAEDIADMNERMAIGFAETRDLISAVNSKVADIHNRIDEETAQRVNLEQRVRSVIPHLPPRPVRM